MSRENKKDWDLGTLLSVVGFVFELVRVTVNALRQRNGTVDHLRRLLKEPALVNQVFDLIVGKVDVIITQTFQSLLEACHQGGHRKPDFTESRWPLEPVAADEADWEVVEHHIQSSGTLTEGLHWLERLAVIDSVRSLGDFRLLTGSRRAMEYISTHQEAQLDHPIILPLRAQDSDGLWCFPVFSRDWYGRQRNLNLDSSDVTFRSHYSWLVLCRKQK